MNDTARGMVSMVPIVTVAADADSDSVNVMHHDINQSLGGKYEYVQKDDDHKWFYKDDIDVTTNANLISGSYTEGGSVATDDEIDIVYIHHTGTTDGITKTTSDIFITIDGGNPTTQPDAILIEPNESWMYKPEHYDQGDGQVDFLHAASSSDTVRCEVAAIIYDI
jgi:hypothetical protein